MSVYYQQTQQNLNPNPVGTVSVAPQQQGMVWNGSSWVVTATRQQQPSLVETYTKYYHEWIASHKALQEQITNQSNSLSMQQKQDLENQVQWAKYYSDLSSQAAHYFHNNPTAISAPFQLPPAPQTNTTTVNAAVQPSSVINNSTNAAVAVTTSSTSTTKTQAQQSQSSTGEGALKRYVDKCLIQCTTSSEKDDMIKLIEKLIQKHLQNNTYQSTNWDIQELLRLPSFLTRVKVTEKSPINGKDIGLPSYQTSSSTNQVLGSKKSHNNNSSYEPSGGKQTNVMIVSSSDSTSYDKNTLGDGRNSMASRKGGYSQNQPFLMDADKKRSPFNDTNSTTGGYYGPTVLAGGKRSYSPSSSSVSASTYGQNNESKKSKKQKRKHEAQHLSSKKPTSTSNHDKSKNENYYGPSTTEAQSTTNSNNSSFSQQQQKNQQNLRDKKEADFIALPATKKKKSNGEMKRTNTGFNDTDLALNDRAKRFADVTNNKEESNSMNGKNFDRFMGKGTIGGNGGKSKHLITLDENDYEMMTIKGTCQILEKDYLRLTAPPKEENVRPRNILEQHLKNLKNERLKCLNGSSTRDYLWFCSQLKALRQDCTVQRIQDDLAIDVYETHARIALEEDDLNEFNQCQTQLKELYRLIDSSGNGMHPSNVLANRNEFVAYRIIYHVFLTGNKKYTGGSSDLVKIMVGLTSSQRQDPAITHALRVREACCNHDMYNYHLFFSLLESCPNKGALLMKYMIPNVRYQALLRICKGYRPGNVEIDFVLSELGFESIPEGIEWLQSCGCILTDDNEQLSTKDCNDIHESMAEEKKTLI